ncbi:MAG: hypothetical protein AAGA69_05570, partial [Pseudomonadota bacterium]
ETSISLFGEITEHQPEQAYDGIYSTSDGYWHQARWSFEELDYQTCRITCDSDHRFEGWWRLCWPVMYIFGGGYVRKMLAKFADCVETA